MSTNLEVTQFSLVEHKMLAGHLAEVAPALNTKEKAMLAFSVALESEGEKKRIASLGGLENIQRIRVYRGEGEGFRFEYALKLPLNVIEQRKRAEVRAEAAKARAEAKAKPAKKALPPEKKVAIERVRFLKSPQGKDAAYALLQSQERKQDFNAAWRQRRDSLKQVKRNVDRKAAKAVQS